MHWVEIKGGIFMQFQEIYERTKYAFEHDEVRELLEGKNGYEYQAPMYPVSLPTCIEFILRDGIYPLYRETGSQQVVDQFCQAIKGMVGSEDAITVWWATSVLFSQKNQESGSWIKVKAPFLVADSFWKLLGEVLPTHKSEMAVTFSYLGNGEDYGLWSDVLRMSYLLNEDYNIQLL